MDTWSSAHIVRRSRERRSVHIATWLASQDFYLTLRQTLDRTDDDPRLIEPADKLTKGRLVTDVVGRVVLVFLGQSVRAMMLCR